MIRASFEGFMLWQLALFSILVPAAYLGIHYVRTRPFGSATFGWMLIGTAALAVIALLGQYEHSAWWEAAAAIAIGAALVQLTVAPLIRTAGRWALGRDHLRLAVVLFDIRDLLQPGMGGRDDKRKVAALRDVREGRVDTAIAALLALRERAPEPARAAIEERVVHLLLTAHRWADAIATAEQTVLARDAVPGKLRVSPALHVELMNARLRIGDFDGAVDLAEEFDAIARNAPELSLLAFRVHLVLLAHTGRADDIERLLGPRNAGYVLPAARRYWIGIARHAAGDTEGARAALGEARHLARRDFAARSLIDDAIARIEAPAPAPTPRALALAEAFAAAPHVLPPSAPARSTTVTVGLVLANLAVAAVTAFLLAGPGDFGAIVRAGANVRELVGAGEPWRLVSSTFVHVGPIHLVVNMLALWALGRLMEGLFGRARMLALYGLAGLAGSIASYAASRVGVSAGASGAIFGLLGAALVELALHRRLYRPAWRRSLFSRLIVVTVAQLAVGFLWPNVDQWAHVGGLVGGGAAAALLSPSWRWSQQRAAVWTTRGLAIAIVALFAASAVAVAITDYGDALARAPRTLRVGEGVAIDLPAMWEAPGRDPDLQVQVQVRRAGDKDVTFGDDDAREIAEAYGLTHVGRAARTVIAVPAGWRSGEWDLSARDELGSVQRWRLVLFVGAAGGRRLEGFVLGPDQLLRDGADELSAIVASARPQD